MEPSQNNQNGNAILLKIDSLRTRARLLTKLRTMLSLPANQDILPTQWEILENQLATFSNKIRQQLRIYLDRYFLEFLRYLYGYSHPKVE
jgi:hypothetical protein